PATYDVMPVFYSTIRFPLIHATELSMIKYNESYEEIENQTIETAETITSISAHYTEVYGPQLILFTGDIDDQSLIRIYSFADVIQRGEIGLPETITEIWEPDDGYCYLIGMDNIYRVTNISVSNDNNKIPVLGLSLINYPNPFNPETTISYNLAELSSVSLKIYNIKGQLVRELVNENQQTGSFEILWNGTDSKGEAVGSGVYLYKLETDNQVQTGKAVLLK
ncbi:MAG: T9SS type A sorting domain-containing protein, partial [Candidatus Cloacimonetes bacterium]|nr:T9SS type A sorting domain-containing protein [Candidatus Cloacimonadota bacterium]